jgi:S-formylglutathione hydrolase
LLILLSGTGAGFYLNATQEKWKNWRMYDYVVKELPELLKDNFPQLDTSKASIFGHSMGGHGALTIYLKNLDKYKVLIIRQPKTSLSNITEGVTFKI